MGKACQILIFINICFLPVFNRVSRDTWFTDFLFKGLLEWPEVFKDLLEGLMKLNIFKQASYNFRLQLRSNNHTTKSTVKFEDISLIRVRVMIRTNKMNKGR